MVYYEKGFDVVLRGNVPKAFPTAVLGPDGWKSYFITSKDEDDNPFDDLTTISESAAKTIAEKNGYPTDW